jgi:predicted dehydrogenase
MNESANANSEFNRRDFLKGGSLAAMMAMMGGVQLIAQPASTATPEKTEVKKIKVALIGLGPWGREILDQLGRLEQADIAAICDTYPAMVRRSSSKAPGAAQVEDYKTIFVNKEIPAVIIATGSHQHKAIALEALQAGKHVYCEAPLAHTVEDAKAIALAAREAAGQVFQAGLQMRSDPQRHFLLPFIRSGALGRAVKVRAQWHKKASWRAASPSTEREKAINWRLDRATSPGLAGEIGIHAIEQAGWFLNLEPVAVTGFGSTVFWKDDGREVPDTVEAVIEYAGGFRMNYQASLATSFDSEYELLHGSDATVMMRDGKAWMFKEVDSPLLGWEVYARKDQFYSESGIVLKVGGSKQTALGGDATEEAANSIPPLYYALESFLGNCVETDEAVADFKALFPSADKKALAESLATIEFRKAATYADGYAATVLALKANEAIVKGTRLELKKEMFELA